MLACALASSGCERIVQPIGEYRAEQQPTTPPRNPQAGSSAHAQAGASSRMAASQASADGAADPTLSAAGNGSSAAWPPNFTDAGADAASAPPDSSSACQPTMTYAANRRRLDMYLVMDANITLPYTGLWEFATAGLRAFSTDYRSQGIGVGLRFFGLECDPDAYDSRPNVEVDLLPANQGAIATATEARVTYTASPMQPALAGGIRHQVHRATIYPDWKQVVVLISDGFTQDFTCPYTEQDIESAASRGFIGPPAIETYVLGFGFPNTPMVASDILARFSPLDSIANSGGTYSAVTVELGTDPQTMNEALQTIRRKAQPCEYTVPRNIDYSLLSLVLTPAGEVPRVDADLSCGRLSGWYYDNPSQPKTMMLCPVSCQALQLNDTQTAKLHYGCPPKRR
jgi:hypothetical protein